MRDNVENKMWRVSEESWYMGGKNYFTPMSEENCRLREENARTFPWPIRMHGPYQDLESANALAKHLYSRQFKKDYK